jgi:CubicO group peptidase (beta-lactamase class C family)
MSTLEATTAACERAVDSGRTLGAYLHVRHADEVLADTAFGQSAPGRPAARDDVGELRCAVKPLTTLCVARALEDGLLDLDDPLARWAPAGTSPRIGRLTLRQLLTHTAGLSNVAGPSAYPMSLDEYVRLVLCTDYPAASWHAGPTYNYAKNWHLLAWVVQQVFARPIQDVITEVVTGPLGLSMSLLDPDLASRPYQRRTPDGRYAPILDTDQRTFASRPNPAYGGFAMVTDLGRLYTHLLACKTGDGGMMRSATLNRLLGHQTDVRFRSGQPPVPIGLGFFLGGGAAGFGAEWGRHAFGHMGSIWAHYTAVGLCDPDTGTVVAVRLSSVGLANNGVLAAIGRAVHHDLGLPAPR